MYALRHQKEHTVTIQTANRESRADTTFYTKPWPTHDPYEVGATSRWPWLLPFKSDRWLREGKAREPLQLHDLFDSQCVGLMEENPIAMIRIEAQDYSPVRLDEFVHQLAVKAGMVEMWSRHSMYDGFLRFL